jgi:putative SOS response-associated peptidase YedK
MSEVDPEFTSIWNTSSPHWRMWLTPENRCLVPANSFAEYAPEPNPETKKKEVVWFALNEDRQLFAFAGIWTEYRGDRGTKSKPVPGPHLVYGFLTTPAVVKPVQEDRPSFLLLRNRPPGPVHERLHLLQGKPAVFVGVHCLENSFVSRLKFRQ